MGVLSEVLAELLPKIWLSVDARGLPGDFVHPILLTKQEPCGTNTRRHAGFILFLKRI